MSLEQRYTPLTITRATQTGRTQTIAAPVDGEGFIQNISGNESMFHLNLDQRVSARLYCPVETDLLHNDIVTQGGVSWVVLYTDPPAGAGGVGHHREALLGKMG